MKWEGDKLLGSYVLPREAFEGLKRIITIVTARVVAAHRERAAIEQYHRTPRKHATEDNDTKKPEAHKRRRKGQRSGPKDNAKAPSIMSTERKRLKEQASRNWNSECIVCGAAPEKNCGGIKSTRPVD